MSPAGKRVAAWLRVVIRGVPPARVSGSYALDGYLALSRRPSCPRTLDSRTTLLANQLVAELSGCRWCIDRGRHEWRVAGLSQKLLGDLPLFPTSSLFTGRDRAALAFVSAVALPGPGARHIAEPVLQRARDYFSEFELAELAALGVGAHDASSYETAGRAGP